MSKVWSICIFEESGEFDFITDRPCNVAKLFNGRALRRARRHIHTFADPFLFVHMDTLYLFAEIQEVGKKGFINCWSTDDIKTWHNIGPILKNSFHYSYPYVFKSEQGQIYMVPEAAETNELALFRFENFPLGLKKVKVIDNGRYADSNIIKKDGSYFLSTTDTLTNELVLFSTADLYGSWQKHPKNPITDDPIINRNGGGFVRYKDRLLRIAQNSSNGYGGSIVVLEVGKIDTTAYRENIIVQDYRPSLNFAWQNKGRHHFSFVTYKGKSIIAMDGLQNDVFLNKLVNMVFKIISL